ncbi:reverse transcriptase domain-containing protein [Tanacetum coccineum]
MQVDYSNLNKVCAKDMYPFPEEGEGLASIMGYPYKCFLRLLKEYSQIRMTEDDKEKTRFHMEEGVYYFTHMPKVLKTSAAKLQRMTEKVLADQRGRNVEIYLEEIVIKSKSELDLVQDVEETLRKLKRVNIKIDPVMSSFGVKEGRFLGYMLTKEGVRADPEKPLANLSQKWRSYPIRKVRVRFETTEGSGWTNEAKEALQRIKRKLNKLQTLAVPKEGEIMMLCLCHKDRTISSVLLVEREGIQIPVSYVSRPLQGMEICYTPMEKMETLDANEGGTLNLNKELQEKSTPTPRAWRLYLGKETIEEGSGVGIILVIPEERMHSYAIRLKFNTFDHAIDCEVLLGGLVVSISKGMKDMHVFMDLPKLVSHTEGNHTVAMEQERKYKKEIINATAPFHRKYQWVSKQDHRWKRQAAARREKQRAMYQVQNQTIIGKLVGAIEGTCNHNIYLIALCNPSEHDKVKFYWTNNNGVNTKHGTKGEAIRPRTGGKNQDPLDGQPHIYSLFAPISEQQVFSGIPCAPPLTGK